MTAVATKVRTSEADTQRINAMFDGIADAVSYLYGRWQDEKEYEDFAEYKAALQKRLPAGFTLVKATQRPFGFEFRLDSFPEALYAVTCTSRALAWSRKS